MQLIKHRQEGFSLLELLLVVAVATILILAGLAIYRNVTSQAQINEATRLLNVLKQETQKLYSGESTYGSDGDNINEIMINSGAVPSAYVTGTDEINSPFDTEVNVVSAGTTFTIEFLDVPDSSCINLGRAYTANDPDFESVDIEGTTLDQPTVADVDGACDNGENDMVWTFN